MSHETSTRRKTHSADLVDAVEEPSGASPLLEQAKAWADVARQAHANCVQSDEAERELRQRRNSSGQ